MAVTDRDLDAFVARGVHCPFAFARETGAGTCCGSCFDDFACRLRRACAMAEVTGECACAKLPTRAVKSEAMEGAAAPTPSTGREVDGRLK